MKAGITQIFSMRIQNPADQTFYPRNRGVIGGAHRPQQGASAGAGTIPGVISQGWQGATQGDGLGLKGQAVTGLMLILQ